MTTATPSPTPQPAPKIIIFDLLTALIDSWTLWDTCAGSPSLGRQWRARYLELTYGCGAYIAYEELVSRAAQDVALGEEAPQMLVDRWEKLKPWEEVPGLLCALAKKGVRMGIVTNCSTELGHRAASIVEKACSESSRSPESPEEIEAQGKRGEGFKFDTVVTAEEIGWYKPRREAYLAALRAMGGTDEMVQRGEVVFVAGSKGDVPGARGVGMRVRWHNRAGLGLMGEEMPEKEGRTLGEALLGIL